MKLQVKEIWSRQEIGRAKEEELLAEIAKYFNPVCPAFVYTAMHHGVALGLYEAGSIQIGMGLSEEITALPLKYVQELRVFNTEKELRFSRHNGEFIWRLREDQKQKTETESAFDEWSILDETHKLWGSTEKTRAKIENWSILHSGRGSAILFPGNGSTGQKRGVVVRNYIQFHSAKENGSLVDFADERLCGFENWVEEECKERGDEINGSIG